MLFVSAPPPDPLEIPQLPEIPKISLHRIYEPGTDPRMSDPLHFTLECSAPLADDSEDVNYDIQWIINGDVILSETVDGADVNDSLVHHLNGSVFDNFVNIDEVNEVLKTKHILLSKLS